MEDFFNDLYGSHKKLTDHRKKLDDLKKEIKKMKKDIVGSKQNVPHNPYLDLPYSGKYDNFYFKSTETKPSDYHRTTITSTTTMPIKSKTKLPVVDNKIKIFKLDQFTSKTHNIQLSFFQHDFNPLIVKKSIKMVGMDKIEWWEYVLIYGIFKAIFMSFEYGRNRDMVNVAKNFEEDLMPLYLQIKFTPKKEFENVNRYEDYVDNKKVLREVGTFYGSDFLNLNVSYKPVTHIKEYRRGYFVYEETIDTFEIDNDKLVADIIYTIKKENVENELLNNILISHKNGRISGI